MHFEDFGGQLWSELQSSKLCGEVKIIVELQYNLGSGQTSCTDVHKILVKYTFIIIFIL